MEEWRDIKGYEGLYQISNLGRVKSLPRKIRNQHCKNEYIKTPIPDKDGYLRVTLYDRGRNKTYAIHKLVAIHFLDNPNNLPIINHKNEIRSDNRVENLEWCTWKYNVNYGECPNKKSKALSKKVICITTGKQFNSIKEAAKYYNIKNKADISRVCKGKRRYCGSLANGVKLEWGYLYV